MHDFIFWFVLHKVKSKVILYQSIFSNLSFSVDFTWEHVIYYQYLPVMMEDTVDTSLYQGKILMSSKISYDQ